MSIRMMAMSGGSVAGYVSQSFQQNTGNSTSLIITPPDLITNGNELISIMGSSGGDNTWTGDTGWTERVDEGAQPNLRVATKVASSESGDYTFTYAQSRGLAGVILNFKGFSYETIGIVHNNGGGDADVVAPTITAASDGSILLAFFVDTTDTRAFSTPSGMTNILSDDDADSPSISVFQETVGSGATGTRTSTPSGGGGDSSGVLLLLTPD